MTLGLGMGIGCKLFGFRDLVNLANMTDSCIGKNLALVELYKAIFLIVDRYDIKLLDPVNMRKEKLKLFLYKTDMMVMISKRAL
jgi:hypothetical protein